MSIELDANEIALMMLERGYLKLRYKGVKVVGMQLGNRPTDDHPVAQKFWDELKEDVDNGKWSK